MMTITMYDLAGAEMDRRFSPFCWRSRMALAHKGLAVETVPWRFTEKDKLPQPNAGRVPVIVDGGRVVHDSTAIADYLEKHYPDRQSLFGGAAGRALARFVHYNIWRALSPPPQDVPLAVCDARSVAPADLIAADAVFDSPGKPEWSFEGLVLAHSPAHRWHWFPDMHRDEALIFKTHDSDRSHAHCVPHVAFDHAGCPAHAAPRISIEMRALALWFA